MTTPGGEAVRRRRSPRAIASSRPWTRTIGAAGPKVSSRTSSDPGDPVEHRRQVQRAHRACRPRRRAPSATARPDASSTRAALLADHRADVGRLVSGSPTTSRARQPRRAAPRRRRRRASSTMSRLTAVQRWPLFRVRRPPRAPPPRRGRRRRGRRADRCRRARARRAGSRAARAMRLPTSTPPGEADELDVRVPRRARGPDASASPVTTFSAFGGKPRRGGRARGRAR